VTGMNMMKVIYSNEIYWMSYKNENINIT